MKLRIIGTLAEIRQEIERLDDHYGRDRVTTSKPYPARREPPGTFRVYAEVAPGPVTVPDPTDKTSEVSQAQTQETSGTT
ncbi:hypothetical protein MF672_010670 [Actinomadura sp. ATCC 31491]|uniref:Uncharacterized protein n=1 Tax=Actinomadura luzonensis TaxID=2805427 RepID=A0ABT0FPJ9_9ACTN|nr:hypothetical protein [Actinomadura luzonensis]MCK2214249.1 hypothetical protein [Actinomadura luzonensis]